MTTPTTTVQRDATTTGYVTAMLSSAILSTTAVFIRYLTNTYQMPPLLLAFWRALFVVVTLLLAFGIWRRDLGRVPRSALPFLAIFGGVLAIFNSLWTLSVAFNGAAIATVLAYSSAAFTAVLGRLFLQERLDASKSLAVVLSLVGCVLVADALDPAAWLANPLGIATGLLTGLGYGVYSLLGRTAAQRGLNPWTSLLYGFGFATLLLLVFNLLPTGWLPGTAVAADFFWLGTAWAGWGVLLLLAAGPTVAGFGLYNVSLSLLPSSTANLILTTEPLFTAVLAFLLLGERLTLLQAAGGLLILSGVVVLRVRNGRGVKVA